MFRRTQLLALVILLAAAVSARAADAPAGDTPGTPTQGQPEMRERLEERIQTHVTLRLAEEMGLDARKEEDFARLMRDNFQEKRKLAREQFGLLGELRGALRDKAGNEGRYTTLLDKLEKNRLRHTELETKLFKDLRKVLTPQQQASMVVLWPRIQEEVRKMIEEFRQKRGGRRRGGAGQNKP